MNEKFNSVAYESLSQNEMQEVNGGFLILMLSTLSFGSMALVGIAVYGAFQMGYDKACECKE